MCGIVAQWGEVEDSAGERMLRRLEHRGPDDAGTRRIGNAWLGHRRLSIVDVGGGHQPLSDSRGFGYLVCNGEIYNHEQIRESLTSVDWQTTSDSEAALHVIERYGALGLSRLHGMFSLVYADRNGRFLAARDPVGIKPLYWAQTSDRIVFASELSAFDPDLRPRVEAFPPGCVWSPERGLQRFASAVPGSLRNAPPDPGSRDGRHEKDMATALRDVLVSSVARQMLGDVPVGVLPSGGLDSSPVAAVAARWCAARGRRLPTFAIGTAASPDLAAARQVAAYLGTDHHEYTYDSEQAFELLPEVVRAIEHFDPSLVRSAVPNYLLAREAAKHVKAVLTGEGADELFGGYEYLTEDDSYAEPETLHRELVRSIEELHGLNLQRCDRVTMAHGLEARVPFLDSDVIAHAMSLPPELKALEPDGMEKGHLRRAFDGWLPESLLWRRKVQFGTGSGAQDVLAPHLDGLIGDGELAAARRESGVELRSNEELAYYRAFRRALPSVRPDAVITRFATA
ncbi:MAG: asparagine synthase (glutamine-hydrolyzing) [bacterium]|nr:asparagine synthase (glutamine-hydrolyzing) [bacterium]